ncbi:MAG: hypothetical protein LQ338_003420 [Usnochroma carphineum]|nr:MAG: hypothetical protein LQ338_003420 [Usnochroma carphineum]
MASGLWSKHGQQPAPCPDWSLSQGPSRRHSPSSVESLPPPIPSSHSLNNRDLTLSHGIEVFPGNGENMKNSASGPPGETGYPSPVSDHSMGDDVNRAPVRAVSEITSHQGTGEQNGPNRLWTERNERVRLAAKAAYMCEISLTYTSDYYPAVRVLDGKTRQELSPPAAHCPQLLD